MVVGDPLPETVVVEEGDPVEQVAGIVQDSRQEDFAAVPVQHKMFLKLSMTTKCTLCVQCSFMYLPTIELMQIAFNSYLIAVSESRFSAYAVMWKRNELENISKTRTGETARANG